MYDILELVVAINTDTSYQCQAVYHSIREYMDGNIEFVSLDEKTTNILYKWQDMMAKKGI